MEDLQKYEKEVTRKLENMVKGFSYIISSEAVSNTPLGDSETYFKLYQARQNQTGLQPVEGFARGSWQVSTTGQFSIQEIYTVNSGNVALSLIKSNLNSYKLGQTLYVGNKGYYIKLLDGGYSDKAPLGIIAPTMESIASTYQVDLKRLYDEG